MLEKRDRSPYWQIRFTLRGRTVVKSSGTTSREQAEALEEKLRRQIWNEAEGMDAGASWEDAVREWNERKAHKRSIKRDAQILDLAGELFRGRLLSEITEDELTRYGDTVSRSTSPGNAARHMAMLRAFFNSMYRWKRMRLPLRVDMPKVPHFEPVQLQKDQLGALLEALPGHMVPLVTFAAETGLRFSNVVGLRWQPPGIYLDLDQQTANIPGSKAKAGKPITIPLSARALDVVRDLERSRTGYVFTDNRGRAPIRSVKRSWHRATKKAGVSGLRFHDLRHAWATWHMQAGTPERVVQELGGWSSHSMVKRYTHLQVSDLRQYVK